MVAGRIDACVPGQKSTVFGLVGPWGSGKTSLIKFILTRLTDNWKVAIFSPWASDNSAGLQVEFLAALASLLEGNDEKIRSAKASLRKYASVCAPLFGVIPGGGSAVAGAAAKALELTETPWHKQFEEVSETLASLGQKVLLVADDIDRLDADELLALLKVVRLLGRFPNVHYLIAYDHATVESLLESRGLGARSSAFMEKIVQYPFEVPPIAAILQRRLLTDILNKFLHAHNVTLSLLQVDRFSEFIAVLAPALLTPRAYTRFGEQLMAFGEMLKFKEIDVVDFVALSFLRVFYHNIYDRIPVWKNALQSGKELVGPYFAQSEINDDEWMSRIRPLVNHDDDAVLVKHILGGLFPGMKSNVLTAKPHQLALSDNVYFSRYFLFGIAEDDIEDQLIESALNNITAENNTHPDVERYRDILDGDNNQLAALAYEKSQRLRSEKLGAPSSNLVLFLFDRLKALPDGIPPFASAGNVLWRWVPLEAFKSLNSGQLTVADMLASLPEEDVLMLAGRILANSRESEESKISALQDLAKIYRDRLIGDIGGLLDSDLDFNSVVSLVSRLSSDKNFCELGDSLVSGGDSELLDRVVRAMVTVNRWGGGDDELTFNGETLTRLFRREAIIQLAGLLSVAPKLSSIYKGELSRENQGYFARASVKSMAEMMSA
jgi:KAP family P-loop domain